MTNVQIQELVSVYFNTHAQRISWLILSKKVCLFAGKLQNPIEFRCSYLMDLTVHLFGSFQMQYFKYALKDFIQIFMDDHADYKMNWIQLDLINYGP